MAKNSKTFVKGLSGNPGGRSPRIGPNGETAAQLARLHTVDAIQTLADVNGDTDAPHAARVAAANALLDRGWGKATETIDLDAKIKNNGPTINLTLTRGDGEP